MFRSKFVIWVPPPPVFFAKSAQAIENDAVDDFLDEARVRKGLKTKRRSFGSFVKSAELIEDKGFRFSPAGKTWPGPGGHSVEVGATQIVRNFARIIGYYTMPVNCYYL
jgi:hypothetical protein